MFCCLWEYRIRRRALEQFLEHYSPGGTWSRLFARSTGFVSTQLLRDHNDPHRFLTIDTWDSADAFESFRRDSATPYGELDDRCETLTISEERVGAFEIP